MISLDPLELSERENYKFLIGSIIPRPVALVSTISSEGVVNAAPFSYFNIVSSNPPMISVSVQRRKGEQKDTARNAQAAGEMVVHITDETIVEAANGTAIELEHNQSELDRVPLSLIPSTKLKVPGIQEAKVRLECMVERMIPLGGTDNEPGCDLIIGKIVHYHIRNDLYDMGKIDPIGLQPVSRLAGNSYSKLGDIFELERP
ncbi:flavin reductase (DIM6/NTAB) family NADH-FMN oxidoreductase RutF [Peribacillus deserti]|uniref:Flavin reductase (DIM6/NTAB) family NADH-FMN oxidoreductase RutF n=1 Tax=Peribacillus deserti TaxID=673318 RepID=A0ABS2QJ11_9BACI|nr:flavin reductase family protein [Peribacillus deserti]MBM7692719.1 flavin reductase (DIM6/NTAB) family NADH-FMN oxidoreductase RutF [Peribacillus deserti]